MGWVKDMKRGYTDRDVERVRKWVVGREGLSGDVIYLNGREYRAFRANAGRWGVNVSDPNVKVLG